MLRSLIAVTLLLTTMVAAGTPAPVAPAPTEVPASQYAPMLFTATFKTFDAAFFNFKSNLAQALDIKIAAITIVRMESSTPLIVFEFAMDASSLSAMTINAYKAQKLASVVHSLTWARIAPTTTPAPVAPAPTEVPAPQYAPMLFTATFKTFNVAFSNFKSNLAQTLDIKVAAITIVRMESSTPLIVFEFAMDASSLSAMTINAYKAQKLASVVHSLTWARIAPTTTPTPVAPAPTEVPAPQSAPMLFTATFKTFDAAFFNFKSNLAQALDIKVAAITIVRMESSTPLIVFEFAMDASSLSAMTINAYKAQKLASVVHSLTWARIAPTTTPAPVAPAPTEVPAPQYAPMLFTATFKTFNVAFSNFKSNLAQTLDIKVAAITIVRMESSTPLIVFKFAVDASSLSAMTINAYKAQKLASVVHSLTWARIAPTTTPAPVAPAPTEVPAPQFAPMLFTATFKTFDVEFSNFKSNLAQTLDIKVAAITIVRMESSTPLIVFEFAMDPVSFSAMTINAYKAEKLASVVHSLMWARIAPTTTPAPVAPAPTEVPAPQFAPMLFTATFKTFDVEFSNFKSNLAQALDIKIAAITIVRMESSEPLIVFKFAMDAASFSAMTINAYKAEKLASVVHSLIWARIAPTTTPAPVALPNTPAPAGPRTPAPTKGPEPLRFKVILRSRADQQGFVAALAQRLGIPQADIDVESEDPTTFETVFVFNTASAAENGELSRRTKEYYESNQLPQIAKLLSASSVANDNSNATPSGPNGLSSKWWLLVLVGAVGAVVGLAAGLVLVVKGRQTTARAVVEQQVSVNQSDDVCPVAAYAEMPEVGVVVPDYPVKATQKEVV